MLDKFLIGCCYYPEHWPDENMRSDIEKIKNLGFNTIRMGEFSWSMYEPQEGEYDFSFLTKAVRIAEEFGLYVVLGTPTAAPPKWLIEKHPEVLCTDAKGTVMQHGGRQHHNHTSEVYLKYCEKITEAMVKNFASFSNVIGWQIDNEFNCHRNDSYSESDDIAFAKWLENKYKTIENLNEIWGTRFWSLEFTSFSQITCPRPHPAPSNPTWLIDYNLFLSDTVINFASVQTKIIRKYMPEAFITHNGYFANIDYKKLTDECLDFLSFDSYPTGNEQSGQGMGRNVEYKLALTRGCSEKFIVPEQQAGPSGQLSYMLIAPRPGQMRLWTYQSIVHGAEGVLYFRYRTPLFGSEQLWYGIYNHDGEENYRTKEARQISSEVNRLGDIFLNERIKCDVAIYKDYHNTCADKVESFASNDAWQIFVEFSRKNVHADFVDFSHDFSKYKVIVFPHITVADETLAEKIKEFTENGGIALISARSGIKDKNSLYRPQTPPGVFRELSGCSVEWFTSTPAHTKQSVIMDGKEYKAEVFYELLKPENGETIATYTEDFCKNKPAIVKNKNVYYIGFYCKESAEIYYDIIKKYIDCPEIIDPKLEEVTMGNYKIYLNHADYEIKLSGYDIIKEQNFDVIEPYGVVIEKL